MSGDHATNPGSLAALARQLQIGLDRSKAETAVPTATLELLLEGLIALAEPGHEAILQRQFQQMHMAEVIRRSDVSEAEANG